MTLETLAQSLTRFVLCGKENTIRPEYALHPELVGKTYYDAPLMGCAAADDPIFRQIQTDPKILGPVFRLPEEWLPGARSVISFFLPYSREIRDSNVSNLGTPSDEWLHARVEGQAFLMEVCRELEALLQAEGYRTLVPAGHPDFYYIQEPQRQERGEPVYASSWSERHVAFAAGLGTFGLSKHIITEKGVCGRFGSVITDAPIDPTPRPYTEPYEYCTFCGACSFRCPVNAISVEKGKDILTCAAFVEDTRVTYAPRYGCGKCQLAVPCSTGIPGK